MGDFEENKDCRLESDLLPWTTCKAGDVDLACKFLRRRRTKIQGYVVNATAKVQELQQMLAKAQEGLAKEVHHYKILDRLLALEDGRRQAVSVKIIPVRRRKKDAEAVKKQDIGMLLSSIPEAEKLKLLASLLEQLKEKK